MHELERKFACAPTLQSDGTRLVTGAVDGLARIWDAKGEVEHILKGHSDMIFAAKWNKKGGAIVTVSNDHSAIVSA